MPGIEARVESTRLVSQAIALQLSKDDGPLEEVEALLLKALGAWSGNLDALEETAYFYDAVMGDSANAVKYATLCREKAAALVASMDEILGDH